MSYRSISVIILASFIAGCSNMPSTANDLVKGVNAKDIFSKKDVYTVDKPLSRVAAILKYKSNECLKKRTDSTNLQATGIGTTGYRTTSYVFTPHVLVSRKRVRLAVQYKDVSEGTLSVGPANGWYFLVVDAYPENRHKTRVESYYRSTTFTTVQPAVKTWLTGSTAGCPDLSK